ncbi:hypothetical protein CTI12_AA222140 [Artemisia annua]|uniref:Uncharacterized protein n=1 Tax=Artemisia annua TaxID=35608 RepID=A0A2U1NV14_ARTAN|nr:hypothetical protein CTI12_AA222140 [Artemisia annua]
MVFSKSKTRIDDATPSESQEFVDLIEDDSNDASEQRKEEKDNKPLLQEVTVAGTVNSKNAGGAKVWICNHCKQQFTSSYTRIHVHILGPPVGKKAYIKRCSALFQDREKYQEVFNKVKQSENAGVSKSLKSFVLLKKPACSKNPKPIEESFGIKEGAWLI